MTNNRKIELFAAARIGDLAKVKHLLTLVGKGANLNARDKDGNTALMMAAMYEHVEVVKVLSAAGANVDAMSNVGRTALTGAARCGHLEVLKVLLAAGADPNLAGGTNFIYSPTTKVRDSFGKMSNSRDNPS